jgi:hypothetical protein
MAPRNTKKRQPNHHWTVEMSCDLQQVHRLLPSSMMEGCKSDERSYAHLGGNSRERVARSSLPIAIHRFAHISN